MVVLKKIKSATLVEVLVATVLLVIVFTVASLVLNNLILNSYSKNTHDIDNKLSLLRYQIQNHQIQFPYQEEYNNWSITAEIKQNENIKTVSILASRISSSKEIKQQVIYE